MNRAIWTGDRSNIGTHPLIGLAPARLYNLNTIHFSGGHTPTAEKVDMACSADRENDDEYPFPEDGIVISEWLSILSQGMYGDLLGSLW